MDMKTLDEIAIEKQTDRATVFTRTYAKPHGYAPHYDHWFTPLRDKPVKLLEIGVGGGEGIQMWLEYFLDGEIFGTDVNADTNPWDRPGKNGRYTFVQGSQSDPTFWRCFLADHGGDWDIIVDDGGHANDQIITSFRELWPVLKSGGFYCIEDLNCGYGPGSIFVKSGWPSHMEFLRARVDELHLNDGIRCIYFAKELAILQKA